MYTKLLDIIKTLQFSILTMQKLQLVICDTFHSVNVAQLTQVNALIHRSLCINSAIVGGKHAFLKAHGRFSWP